DRIEIDADADRERGIRRRRRHALAEGLRRETNGQQGGQHDRADTQAPEGCGIHDVHAVSFSLAKLLFRCEMAVGRAEPADFDRTHSITHTAAPAAFASWPR